VEKYTLSNGLRVLIEPIPSCRSVSFGIWVKTGSRHETPETNGISHFIEHMLFKGTKRHTAQQIADRFDGIGGNVNAFTSKEYTCYYAKVLDEHLPIAVDMLADMFFESVFAEEELAKRKTSSSRKSPCTRTRRTTRCTTWRRGRRSGIIRWRTTFWARPNG
jgi:predicted Zn-dependent peptidase